MQSLQDYVRHNRPLTIGALQLSLESVLAIVILPALLLTAAISDTCLFVVAVALPAILIATHYFSKAHLPQTRFFFTWALCSIVSLWVIFEITVPLLELLPEENLVFRLCIFGSIFCFYRTKVQAAQSFSRPVDESTAMDEQRDQTRLLLSGDEALDDDSVEVKRSRRPRGHFGRTLVYCDICQQHVVGRYHHSRWLDCCISDVNVGFFLFGCGLGLFGLLFGSNLALTSICHPFYLFSVFGVKILLPDDCSDVFDQYNMGLSFVGGIYATTIGICGLLVFIRQIYQILVQKTELKRSCLFLRAYICCYRL